MKTFNYQVQEDYLSHLFQVQNHQISALNSESSVISEVVNFRSIYLLKYNMIPVIS